MLQMTLLAMSGGLLGILFMIPLRRFLIEREHGKLPYPEGTACAEVLVANEADRDLLERFGVTGRSVRSLDATGDSALVDGLVEQVLAGRI